MLHLHSAALSVCVSLSFVLFLCMYICMYTACGDGDRGLLLLVFLLLSSNSDCSSSSTSRLGVLSTNTDAPVVAESTMEAHLLHSLEIVTQLLVKLIGSDLPVSAVLDVLLSIQKPVGDLELAGIGDDQNPVGRNVTTTDIDINNMQSCIYREGGKGDLFLDDDA